jgi:hypothetical protein
MKEPTSFSQTAIPTFGAEFSAAFARQTAAWMEGQGELLTSAGTMVADWFNRHREAIDLSSRSLRRVWECRDLNDLLQAQQQWAGDCLRWTAAGLRAAGRDTNTLTEQMMAQLRPTGREPVETVRRDTGRRTVPEPAAAAAK